MSSESLLKEPLDSPDPDAFHQRTSVAGNLRDVQDYLVFFISGNPGLLSFYQPFLMKLTDLLDSKRAPNARFHVHGHSFKGFELSPNAAHPGQPSSLYEQIDYQEKLLMQFVKENEAKIKQPLKVILVGHSVGSYILLELIQRHLLAVQKYRVDFDLIGGILLFPTIADIAQSPLGRIARLILPLPGFDRMIGAFAHLLSYMLPPNTLTSLIGFVTGFPDYAVASTESLLRSRTGVRQAMYVTKIDNSVLRVLMAIDSLLVMK